MTLLLCLIIWLFLFLLLFLLIFFIIKYISFLGFSTVNLLQKIITVYIVPLFAVFIFFMNGPCDILILPWIKWWKFIKWRLGSTVKNPSFGT